MRVPLAFPVEAPFRVDQTMSAPLAMTCLCLGQLLFAALISHFALAGRRQWWWITSAALVASEVLFFTLASWGNSDTTKLSHDLAFNTSRVKGEPLWILAAPLIVSLPYRMSMVHGLVAGGYSAVSIFVARVWRCPAWGGWWSLLICCSPLLRGFLQNAHSRQALLSLLLIPLLLWACRMEAFSRRTTALASLLAATVHTSFLGTFLLALIPRVLDGPGDRLSFLFRRFWSRTPWLHVFFPLLLVSAFSAPVMMIKLIRYVNTESYSNQYALALPVKLVQLSMALGVLIVCWQRRLRPSRLIGCRYSLVLLLFAMLFVFVQCAISQGLVPQITCRLSDVLGLFLLFNWLIWLRRYDCLWASLPTLLVTLDYWLIERLIASNALLCGHNDEFMCVPDRWPWEIDY